MPIIAGKVLYSKTIQERQFEPLHASVELTVEVADGEVLGDLLQEAFDVARQEVAYQIGKRSK